MARVPVACPMRRPTAGNAVKDDNDEQAVISRGQVGGSTSSADRQFPNRWPYSHPYSQASRPSRS